MLILSGQADKVGAVADKDETVQLQRVEIRDPERTSLWTGLAVGLGLAALVGVVVALIMRRRDDDKAVAGVAGVGNYGWNPQVMPPVSGYDNLGRGDPRGLPFNNPYSMSPAQPPEPPSLPSPPPLHQLRIPPV